MAAPRVAPMAAPRVAPMAAPTVAPMLLLLREVSRNKASTVILETLAIICMLQVLMAKGPQVHAMNKMKLNLLQVKEEVGESVSKVTLDPLSRIMWSLKRVKQAKLWKL